MVDLNLNLIPRGIDLPTAEGFRIMPTRLFGLNTHVEGVLGKMKYSPNFYLYTQPDIPTVSQIAGKLANVPFRLKNPTPEHSVEDESRWQIDGLLGTFYKDLDINYNKFRQRIGGKEPSETVALPTAQRIGRDLSLIPQRIASRITGSEPPISSSRFGEEIVKAKRRWFASEPFSQHPEVVNMVKNIHKNVFEPMLEDGLKHGVFENPEAFTDVLKRQRYVPQVWDSVNLQNNRPSALNLFMDNHKENVRQKVEGYENLSDADLVNIYNGVIDNIIASHDGILRNMQRQRGGFPGRRAPAKVRQIDINPYMIDGFENAGLLVSDLGEIVSRYVRMMVPQIRFAEKFGELNFEKHFDFIDKQYNEEIMKYPDNPAHPVNKRKRLQLEAQKIFYKKYIQFQFDRIMGYGGVSDDPTSWAYRVVDVVKAWNIPTKLGTVVASSITDLGLHVARQGLAPIAKTSLKFLTNAKEMFDFAVSANEVQNMANIHELIMNHYMREYSDVSFAKRKTAIERGSEKIVGLSGIMTGLSIWDHYMKSFSVIYNGMHMIEIAMKYAGGNTLSKSEELFLQDMRLSLDDLMLLSDQYMKYGTKSYNNIHHPNLADWDNDKEVRKLKTKIGVSLKTEATRSQNIPTSGSLPMSWRNNQIIGVLVQFKQFMWTFPEKVFIPALQGPKRRILESVAVALMLGAVGYYWKERSRGKPHEEVVSISSEELVMRSLQESGWMMQLEYGNRLWEDVTGGNSGLGQMTFGEPLSRGYTTDKFDIAKYAGDLGGPFISQAFDAGYAAAGLYKYFADPNNMKRENISAARRLLIPFQNHLLFRSTVDSYQKYLEEQLGAYR